VDDQAFFDNMLNSIGTATDFIYLEMYLFESGEVSNRFIDAFVAATERNVSVYILLDDYGCQGLEQKDRQRLTDAGVQLCFYNPVHYGRLRRSLFRDHRKLLLIDGLVAYTGGVGITDEFDSVSHPRHYWHDAMVKVTGTCAGDWQALFEDSWGYWGEAMSRPVNKAGAPAQAEQRGRVVEGHSVTHSEVIRSFIHRIRNADRRVWLATAYFVPSRKFRSALRRQAEAGVDVRLLLPGPHSDHPWTRHMGRHFYDNLLRSGVRIFEYQPRFLHMKILLCDDWVSIGSSNVDRWNFRWNLEANQEIDDAGFATLVEQQFNEDFSDCDEILAGEWKHRSWWQRIVIWYWAQVVRFLSWMSYNRKGK